MEKLIYQTPEMEITRFDAEDIIRTSGDYHHGTDVMPAGNIKAGNDLFYGTGLS